MPLEPEHVYVIPPGAYLAIRDGALRLSKPRERHGARLPFDFFLRSLAEECGERAICVILSGTGSRWQPRTEGDQGEGRARHRAEPGRGRLRRHAAQRDRDRRRRSRAPGGENSGSLAKYARRMSRHGRSRRTSIGRSDTPSGWREIIDLLRTRTSHDFTLYKPGTLQRRIERRMAMAGDRRQQPVSRSAAQGRRRARASRQGPAHQRHELFPRPQGLRSAGGEGRSRSRAPAAVGPAATHLGGRLQHRRGDLFDRHALSRGDRGGATQRSSCRSSPPMSMATRSRSPAREFIRNRSRRMCRRLGLPASSSRRTTAIGLFPSCATLMVFTMQDVLADPPFSRLDLVSCRNLLIYLRPEAQAEGPSAVPFCAARGRHPVSRRRRDGGAISTIALSRSPRRSGSIGISVAAGRARSIFLSAATAAGAAAPAGARRRRAGPQSRRACAAGAARRLCAGLGSDQSQGRVPLLFSGRRTAICGWPRASPAATCLRWRATGCAASCRAAIQQANEEHKRALSTGGAGEAMAAARSRSSIAVAAGAERRRGLAAGQLPRRTQARAEAGPARRSNAGRTSRGSPSWSASSTPPARNCRAPSAISRSPTRSRRRSTKKRCR